MLRDCVLTGALPEAWRNLGPHKRRKARMAVAGRGRVSELPEGHTHPGGIYCSHMRVLVRGPAS